MPGNSRLRILEHIRMHGEASIADLSRDLNLTPVTVRHHVDALSEQGLVTRGSLRRKPGPGRPEAMYQSTPLAAGFLPRNYGELGGSLITELAASMPVDRLEGLLVLAARRLAASLPPPMERMGSDRLGHVTGLLEARGYLPWVQISQGDVFIRFANCPYFEVARQVPSLCCFDVELLRDALGCDVWLEARITSGDAPCRLRVADDVDGQAQT